MPEELPKGWVRTTLAEIRHYVGVGISQNQMRGETFELYSVPAYREGKPEIIPGEMIGSNKIIVHPGDVLLCKINPRINRAWVVGEQHQYRQIASTEWIIFSKQGGISPDFLSYFFKQDEFRDYLSLNVSGVGGSLMRVSSNVISMYLFPLPPAAEQERIAGKLGAGLSRLQQGEIAARRALERIQRYRSAVVLAGVTGEFTKTWRVAQEKSSEGNPESGAVLLQRLLATRRNQWEDAELKRLRASGKEPKNDKWKSKYPEPTLPRIDDLPKLPEGWIGASLDQIGELNRGKSKHRPRGDTKLYGGPYPFIQTGDIRKSNGTIREHTQTYSEFGLNQSQLWPTGTLCITIAANIAETGILSYPACFPDSVVGFVQDETLLKVRFVEFFIRSQKSELRSHAPATAQKNINLGLLKGLAIPLPPRTEQIKIIDEIERRLSSADKLVSVIERKLDLALALRQSLLREAFSGHLVQQDSNDEPASVLLERIRKQKIKIKKSRKQPRQRLGLEIKEDGDSMQKELLLPESLSIAWEKIGRKADARLLFNEAEFSTDHVEQFYEALRANPEILTVFQEESQRQRQPLVPAKSLKGKRPVQKGSFRILELWLEDFKNLKDYIIQFDSAFSLNVILGWNGTGKSNLFEALIIIFRDLHEWCKRNRWPDKSMNGYRLKYEIDENTVEITWRPGQMRRPDIKKGPLARDRKRKIQLQPIKRGTLPLPHFIFAYYSGPTNRLAEHFLPMKQAHYVRLRKAKADDAETLADLLEQRRFFCAETHHAKYVLLAFLYKDDLKISEFLKDRLRILGFESALFIIRKPRWARPGSKAKDFWGAKGIMRRVMERLSHYAIAPMILDETVNDGYRSTTEEHYCFFLPDQKSLQSFAAEYEDARTFFLALESTDFSELIFDVKIQVRIEANNVEQIPITFHELSEGEQQLLMVLGLMRFTKSHQSLILLDEPDTHLNPHWSVNYLKDLLPMMSDTVSDSTEQQSSQILMATHDPLVIASLVKEQIHLLRRDPLTGVCKWTPADVNPRGLGFTGILTEMFDFRSGLDPETLTDLDDRIRLIAKEGQLTESEKKQIESIDSRLIEAGFASTSKDPYYVAFLRAWSQRYSDVMAKEQFLTPEKRQEVDRIARDVLEEAISEVKKEVSG